MLILHKNLTKKKRREFNILTVNLSSLELCYFDIKLDKILTFCHGMIIIIEKLEHIQNKY
jgi:hypothetical protein